MAYHIHVNIFLIVTHIDFKICNNNYYIKGVIGNVSQYGASGSHGPRTPPLNPPPPFDLDPQMHSILLQ